jgi:phage terminase small subunit
LPALRNPRQERFVQELVKGRTQREAYRLAGYTAERGQAARLARRAEVAARYQELAEAAARISTVTAAKVIDALGTIAFANLSDFITTDADGKPQADLAKVSREQKAALLEVTSDARGVRVKLADKLEALDMLGKMLGLYRERIEPPPEEKPEELSDYEAARRIAFILRKAHADRGGVGEPTLESFA